MSKYGTKCSYTNHKGELIDFDSIPEMYFYQKLERFKEQGKIKDFKQGNLTEDELYNWMIENK